MDETNFPLMSSGSTEPGSGRSRTGCSVRLATQTTRCKRRGCGWPVAPPQHPRRIFPLTRQLPARETVDRGLGSPVVMGTVRPHERRAQALRLSGLRRQNGPMQISSPRSTSRARSEQSLPGRDHLGASTFRWTGSSQASSRPSGLIDGWAEFFVATGGAAAALTGLLFIAVSLRPSEIRESPRTAGRAPIGPLRLRHHHPGGATRLVRQIVSADRRRAVGTGGGRTRALGNLHDRSTPSESPPLRPGARLSRRPRRGSGRRWHPIARW
jgi:hypothetical protein